MPDQRKRRDHDRKDNSHSPLPYKKPLRLVSLKTKHAIRRTLRSALTGAVRQELISVNVASLAELEAAEDTRPMVWTAAHIANWVKTGARPSPVMVWTAEQVGAFLDHASDNRLYALFHTIAYRGLRRGEALGLTRHNLDLDRSSMHIRQQLTVDIHGKVHLSLPKADSRRTVMLDSTTVRVLKEHLAHQAKERLAAGPAWMNDPDYLFTSPDGSRLHPSTITTYFARLAESSGLPPIRLHDLRHCAASLALAAGMEMKEIQAMLGHREMSTTSDIYVSLLPDQQQASAEAVANLIGRHRRRA